ncbi:MAG: DUF4838 domain-containing protein [Oscillospiraceae bacterium]|nr:DUF4838 domain-containing protein [Oscillospiraceae bacterium]
MANFFSSIISSLIIFAMLIGLYNPGKAAFDVPPPPEIEVYDGETITVAEDGLSDYVIVIGENAIPAEVTAAEKLQGFLKEISGAELEIARDYVSAQAEEIVIGDTNRYPVDYGPLGDEGFIIKTYDEKVIIAGGKPRGTLYGIYDFLEKFAGCRWYSKDTKFIPSADTFAVPVEIDEIEIPAFEYRASTTVQNWFSGKNGYDIDSALANRVNDNLFIQHWFPELTQEKYGGNSGAIVFDHSGDSIMSEVIDGEWCPMSSPKYFEKHKDLFAKDINGNPIGGYSNPCFSKPEVLEIYVAHALGLLAQNPALKCVSISLNDSGAVCQCAECKEAYFVECGVPKNIISENCSGSYFPFQSKVCERLADAGYPDVRVASLGYAITQQAPKTPLHPNATIWFCPIGMCYAHKAGECTHEETRITFDVDYAAWLDKCDKIAIFDYPLNYNHWGVANPLWGNIQSYMQMYRDDGIIGLINCASNTDDIGLYQMTGYLYARLLWNPDADMEELYNSFLPYYYGEGWQYVREYIRIASEELTGRTIGGVTYHTNCLSGSTPVGNLAMTNNQVKYINKLWDKAKELSAGQPQQLINIRRAELSWRMWKSDNLRGEFWPINLTGSRMKSNTALFNDIIDLGIEQHSEGGLYVKAEDFEELQLNLLTARYWSWRQIGRSHEGNIHNVWEMLWALIT